MPRESPSDSKQAFIVALVFFVLLSIILGVTTYLGFSGQSDLEKKRKDADDKLTAMKSDRDTQQAEKATLKLAIGIADKTDSEVVNGASGKTQQAIGALVPKLQDITWVAARNNPLASYIEQIASLNAKIKGQDDNLVRVQQANDAAVKDLKDKLNACNAEKAQLDQQLKAAQAETLAVRNAKYADFEKLRTEFNQQINTIKKLKKDHQDERDDWEKKTDKLTKEIKDLKINYEKAERLANPPPNLLNYEKAQGKVIYLDNEGKFAYIDLGSADRVKPQLTFSIYGPGRYKADRDPKGSLEIVSVLRPHLSQARITGVLDPNRDPVTKSDLIYNPAWSPTLKQHVAIAGLIDLTGDGRDSTPEFIRNLQKQNVVVDAYLDLKDATVKGAISRQTNYLVVGEIPKLDLTLALKQAAVLTERKKEITLKIGELQDQAKSKGITVVPYRQFLALIGYNVPRTTAAPEFNLPPYRAPALSGEAKEPAKAKGEPGADDQGDKPAKGKGGKKPGKQGEKPAPEDKEK